MRNINSIPLAAAILLGATGVSAQQRSGLVLEEVVVTARKIEENLQDVPLSITAFSSQEIESAGINNLYDVANFTPGLTFSNVQGEFLPVPVIRGMAPTAIFRENNAAIFVNGIYVSAREGLNFSQLDLERIEVVKGPQAAMYGRNSFSGALNFVTAKPTDEFQGKAELTLGDDDRRTGSVSVSGPLVEGRLRGRVALLSDAWGGSYKNAVAGGPDIGGYDYQTFQGSLYFTPTETFEAALTTYVSNDQIDDSATSAVQANCEDISGTGARLANFCGELPSVSENDLSIIGPAVGEDRDVIRANLTLTWDTNAGTFTSLTGYDKVQQSYFVDGSRGDLATTYAYQTSISPFPGGFVLGDFGARLLQVGPGSESEEFSQEFRFTSNEDRKVRYSVGTYLYSTEATASGDGVVSLDSTPRFIFSNFCPCIEFGAGSGLGFALPAFPGGPSIGDFIYGNWFNGVGDATSAIVAANEVDSWAVFGSLETDFTDRLTGRVELRYTDDEKTVDDRIGTNDFNNSWDFLTWRASLDFKLRDEVMLYGSIASAEKSGDFDAAAATNVNNENVLLVSLIDPEKNLSYELGVKGTYLDGRLRSDIALFYTDWSDIVIPQVADVDNNGVPLTQPEGIDRNGGDATIVGVEVDLQYALTESLTAQLGFTVTNAEFDNAIIESFVDFPSIPNGDVSGNTILRQSEAQGNLSLTYRRGVRNDLDFFMRGDVLYQGKQFVGADNQGIVPAHTYVNLRLGLDSDRFTLELWGENIFQDNAPVAAYRDVYFSNALPDGGISLFNTLFPFRLTVSHPRLRQIGLTGRVRF